MKYKSIVENDQRRYKLEMEEYNKQKKALESPDAKRARHSDQSKTICHEMSKIPNGSDWETRNKNESNVGKQIKLGGVSNGYDSFVENDYSTPSIDICPEDIFTKKFEITHENLELNGFEISHASKKHVINNTPYAPESDKDINPMENHPISFNQ